MANVLDRINVSVDTGDLDGRIGIQVEQIKQIVELIKGLIENPPDDVGDLLNIAQNLPLPEFDIQGDFSTALSDARAALPTEFGDLTAGIDGDLNSFPALIEQLQEIMQDAVKAAAAIERLTSLDFRCGAGGDGAAPPAPAPGDPPPAEENPAAQRMARTAQQTQQVNDMLDRLPASPTVGGLLEFFFPIIDNKPHDKLFQLTLPVIDDVIEPLRTLSRWAALDANAVGGEIEATITLLTQRLRSATRQPIDTLGIDLNDLQTQLDLAGLATFADAYDTALTDLRSALESGDPSATTAPVTALNLALDNAAATLGTWDAALTAQLQAMCERVHDLDESLLDQTSHLLTLLEPIELPGQFIGTLREPQPPSPEAIAAVQEAVQPVLDWLNELLGLLDFSALQGEVGGIATQAQQIADSVEQGLTGISLQVQSLFDQLSTQMAAVDLNALRDQLTAQLQAFVDNLQRQLGNAISPANTAISEAVQTLSDTTDNFDPADVVDALRSVLQTVTSVLDSGEIADAIETIREAIASLTETLEQLSFAPVTDEVIELIEQMTAALRQFMETDLNDAAKAALMVAMEILPDDITPVTDPLLEEFDELIEGGPVPLLERVAEKPAELLDAITRFQPGSLVGDALGGPYREALEKAEAFQPSRLFNEVDEKLQDGKDQLLKKASPGKALDTLSAPFDQLKQEILRYSPDTVLEPIEQRIEGVIQQVIEASPIDEIFAQVNRVFALIEQALDVPRNLVGTLQRLDTLLGQLANSNDQINTWRDGLLDKAVGAIDASAITAALNDLNSAVTDAAHTAVLTQFDTVTTPIRDALNTLDASRRLTELTGVYQRAQQLAQSLPDSAEKTAALAALDRLEPGRAPALQTTAQLQRCLDDSRDALAGLQQEWQELLEGPDSLLGEIAAVTADTAGLRQLMVTAIDPLLAPLRHLFALLESVRPALQTILTTVSNLVDQLTGSAAALLTGPASLQTISDAVQQVVDTLRNIDLSFLRQGLQQLFVQLVGQLDALDPARLGQELDDALAELLEPIGLGSIIEQSTLDTLDADFESVIDKLRDLDPERLITEVVQPEYDATVVPLVEAFDLTPAFNALIEFLRGLNEELSGELGRVNTAYQGLLGARPDSINVNISL